MKAAPILVKDFESIAFPTFCREGSGDVSLPGSVS